MFNTKTHFPQVPLAIVKKIVEEQIQAEATSEASQKIDKKMLSEGLSEAEGRSSIQPRALIRVESVS